MSDCLYGQQLALAHGFGWLVDPALIAQHLAAELAYNSNPYGLTCVTGRHTPPPEDTLAVLNAAHYFDPADEISAHKYERAAEVRETLADSKVGGDGQDDVIWMGAAPDWSCLALALGEQGPGKVNVTAALEPTRWELENYRSRLNSMWDLTGISTSGDWGSDAANGQPFCTSHYGFIMTDYYLLYTLSGQQTNIPEGKLSFTPLLPCPFNVPMVMMGVEGTFSCDGQGRWTLAVFFGEVNLQAGGLTVNNQTYPEEVHLVGGQSVTFPS